METNEPLKAKKPGVDLTTIFASFYIGSSEIAICVEHIQEVVNFPDRTMPMPLAPEYLDGVFNLRGKIVPIINLKRLLKLGGDDSRKAAKVAILNFSGAKVGLAFDSTGEVLRPRPDELGNYEYREGSEYDLIRGAIKLADGKRILQVLDPRTVVSIKNIPQFVDLDEKDHAGDGSAARTTRKKCISFSVAGTRLAFEITAIHEIVSVPEIQESALSSKICLGLINLRSSTIPIIDFARLLKAEGGGGSDESARRIIILKLGDELFGLMVNSVESINSYKTDAIMPIPILNGEKAEVFTGGIRFENGDEAILLDHEKLLTKKEILEITHGHAKLFRAADSADRTEKERSAGKQSYISFRIGRTFGVPIGEVKEIIRMSSEVVEAPGMPDFVRGVLNLRGKLIAIIDARKLYDMAPEARDGHDDKIIIFQSGEELIGLIVDSVESILSVDPRNKLKLPDVLGKTGNKEFDQDVSDFIEIKGASSSGSMMVLNTANLFRRVQKRAS